MYSGYFRKTYLRATVEPELAQLAGGFMKSKILALAMALSLSACGGGGNDGPPPTPTSLAGLDTSGPVGQMILAQDEQFCFDHAGILSHRFMENLAAVNNPGIIQTTFQAEVTCNDNFSAVKTFVIATGEMIS